jgi:iduronate 2-sulfatase
VCALARLEPPAGLPGKSLVPILEDVNRSVQDAVFHVFPRGTPAGPGLGRAVRTARHRYVEWRAWKTGDVVGRELYDYETDPAETENLVDRPEHAALVKELAARLAVLGPAKPQVKKDPTLAEPIGAK